MEMRAAPATAAAACAFSLFGCGYEPEPDRRSDPLSPRDNAEVARQIDALDASCNPPDLENIDETDLNNIDEIIRRYIEAPHYNRRSLTAIAREHPHAVFRDTTNHQDEFTDETMIQVLERLANSHSDCDDAKPLGDVAERLRSPR
jgi:hypothetical protein